MVDAGLNDFKPFVHSDCGGDVDLTDAGLFLRWTEHCALGSIFRYHGGDHRPWQYKNETHLNAVRDYLQLRYRLLPSILAAGQRATMTGIPLVARGDFYWPEHKDSASNQQYVFLDCLLLAPLMDNHSITRSVWVPPGVWEDAWSGESTVGPAMINVTQPFDRIPLWHRRDGSFLVLAEAPTLRVDEQDWSTLTLEAFPSQASQAHERSLFERCAGTTCASATPSVLHLESNASMAQLTIQAGSAAPADRSWVLRLRLPPGRRVRLARSADGEVPVQHIPPSRSQFPLRGSGEPAPPLAGAVAEVHLKKGTTLLRAWFANEAAFTLTV